MCSCKNAGSCDAKLLKYVGECHLNMLKYIQATYLDTLAVQFSSPPAPSNFLLIPFPIPKLNIYLNGGLSPPANGVGFARRALCIVSTNSKLDGVTSKYLSATILEFLQNSPTAVAEASFSIATCSCQREAQR
jgi:hypothetical protein